MIYANPWSTASLLSCSQNCIPYYYYSVGVSRNHLPYPPTPTLHLPSPTLATKYPTVSKKRGQLQNSNLYEEDKSSSYLANFKDCMSIANLQSCKYTLLLFGSVLVIYVCLTIFNNIKSEKQWVYSCPFLGYSNLYIAKTVVSRCNNESIKFVKTSQIILFEKNNLVTNNR